MSKINVLIITRKEEYLDGENLKPGREEYGRIIKEQLVDFSYEDIESEVKKFFIVSDIVNPKYKQFVDGSNESMWRNFSNKVFDVRVKTKEELFFQLMSSEMAREKIKKEIDAAYEKIKNKKCYVKFSHGNYDIILLLWDMLERDSGEQITPFGLFIQAICKDCGLTDEKKDKYGNTNNILYVHDRQLIEKHDDATIWTRDNSNFEEKYKIECMETLKRYFDYVAAFGHLATDGIFQNYILKFQFGPTVADKIAAKESNAKSFSSLREKSDEIISESDKKINDETNL